MILTWLLPTLIVAAPGEIFLSFDADGTPVFTDRPADGRARRYRLGTFEEVALRQQNVAHRGDVWTWREAPLAPPDVLALIGEMSARHGVPRSLLMAMCAVESSFKSGRVSRAGARGLMQLMPQTARDLGVDPDDDRQNVDGGARYLAFLLRHFGDESLAVAAYNAGPGRVMREGNRIPDIAETRAYVDSVLELERAYAE